jgi:FkbM family methyltransferase
MTVCSEKFRLLGRDVEVTFPAGAAVWPIRQILAGQEYPLLDAEYEPDCVIDVGANVGAAALFFASAYPWARFYCFEPSSTTFEYLERNVKPIPSVRTFKCGLGESDGEAKLYLGRQQCLQSSMLPNLEVLEEFELVRVRRASSALADLVEGRCILKIDTEGSEVPILEDLHELLPRVDILYVEYHSERDRRAIDRIVAPTFSLWRSHAQLMHRGNVVYVSDALVAEVPSLAQWEIRR